MSLSKIYKEEAEMMRKALAKACKNNLVVGVLEGGYVSGGCRIRFGRFENKRGFNISSNFVKPLHESIKFDFEYDLVAPKKLLEEVVDEFGVVLEEIDQFYLEGPIMTIYRISEGRETKDGFLKRAIFSDDYFV